MVVIFLTEIFFDLSHTIIGADLKNADNLFSFITNIKDVILKTQKRLGEDFIELYNGVYVHKSATVADNATIIGPAIIDENASVRSGAFIRENVIIGKGAVVGNSTEVKNAVLFDEAKCPHFNYIGDSILGYKTHLGAGVIISNLRLDKSEIKVVYDGVRINTHLRKFGAIIADGVEVGCNSVINPGSIIHKHSLIHPLSKVVGEINGVYKGQSV